jgi:hypothetical protein
MIAVLADVADAPPMSYALSKQCLSNLIGPAVELGKVGLAAFKCERDGARTLAGMIDRNRPKRRHLVKIDEGVHA